MTDASARILLVDDNLPMLRSLARMLSCWGYQCETFGSGPPALAAARVSAPDVALVDLYMPDMDGREVIAELRRISPSTSIIAISGDQLSGESADLAVLQDALGVMAMLQKPIEPNRLRELITRALTRR